MPKVYLIEGPVGSGKSTYAKDLARQTLGVHIALDQWFAALFSPDRPAGGFLPSWYGERKQRLLEVIWKHGQEILASGTDAILELGLIQGAPRRDFCRRVLAEGHDLEVHVLDAPHEVRRDRVRGRNTGKGETFAMVVPDEVFELASKLWEPPDEAECDEYAVNFVARPPQR